eukprot:1433493-Rhodomonas_salina.6
MGFGLLQRRKAAPNCLRCLQGLSDPAGTGLKSNAFGTLTGTVCHERAVNGGGLAGRGLYEPGEGTLLRQAATRLLRDVRYCDIEECGVSGTGEWY